MGELAIHCLIMTLGVLLSSISQVMLKKSAEKHYENRIREYLNPFVIIAYGLFFCTTLISVFSLKVVPLSMAPIIESIGYIFVAVLGYIFLKERMTRKQVIGMGLIIAGIVVYSLKF